jgi:hypothetical protein
MTGRVHSFAMSDEIRTRLPVELPAPGGKVHETRFESLLAEREARLTPEAKLARQRANAEANEAALRASVAPLSVGRYKGHRRELTVRAAAVELFERWTGRIEVWNGALRLSTPPITADGLGQPLREVVDVLVAAEPLIVATAKRPGPVDPAKLPDVLLSPWGAGVDV